MKACIFALLVFSLASFGQPMEGPYIVIESDSAIHHIHVTARNDSIADVFWQVGDTAFHAAFGFQFGSVYAGPENFLSDSGWVRTLRDALRTDGGWVAVIYDISATRNRTKLLQGLDSVAAIILVDSSRNCLEWQFGGSTKENTRLYDSGVGSVAVTWIDYWSAWVGFPESGIGCVARNLTLPDGQVLSAGEYPGAWFSDVWAINADTDTPAVAGIGMDGSSGLCIDALYGNGWWFPCTDGVTINCPSLPIDWLTVGSRILMLSRAVNQYSPRILEVDTTANQCTELLVSDQQPIVATSDPDFGFAWLSQPSSGLLLNRADTSGVLVQPAGVIYWPEEGVHITGSNIALSDSGKIMIVWTTEEIANPGATELWIAAVDWDTPLSVNPEPERTAVRRYELNAYPNPFNAEATLSFTLPNAGQVSLKVFDVTGRLVTTLLENERKSSGNHHIILDASGLASGIYLCQLTLGEMKSVRKVVVLK